MTETLVVMLLAVWAGAIAVLVNVDRADEFLWIPVLLALAGVFSSLLPFTISLNMALPANAAILALFIVSLEVLNLKPQLTFALKRHRA